MRRAGTVEFLNWVALACRQCPIEAGDAAQHNSPPIGLRGKVRPFRSVPRLTECPPTRANLTKQPSALLRFPAISANQQEFGPVSCPNFNLSLGDPTQPKLRLHKCPNHAHADASAHISASDFTNAFPVIHLQRSPPNIFFQNISRNSHTPNLQPETWNLKLESCST
jgi:hypothetical protein